MRPKIKGAVTRYCPNDGAGQHDQRPAEHTESDGRVRRIVYCVRCGAEWDA